MPICNRLDLQTLESQPVMPKSSRSLERKHCLHCRGYNNNHPMFHSGPLFVHEYQKFQIHKVPLNIRDSVTFPIWPGSHSRKNMKMSTLCFHVTPIDTCRKLGKVCLQSPWLYQQIKGLDSQNSHKLNDNVPTCSRLLDIPVPLASSNSWGLSSCPFLLHLEGIAWFLLYPQRLCRLPINLSTSFHKSADCNLSLSVFPHLSAMAASSSMGSSSPSSSAETFSSLQFHVSVSSEENSLDPKIGRPHSVKVFRQSPVRIVGFKLHEPTTRRSPAVCLLTLLCLNFRWLNISVHIEQWWLKSFTCTQECNLRDCVKYSIIVEEMK